MQEIKKILGNSLWVICEKILTLILTVIVTALIARYLGVEQYGIVNYVISIVMLFTTFSTLGMEKITIKDIVDEKEDEGSILGTSLLIRLIGGIILIVFAQITLIILNGFNWQYQILGIILGSSMIFKAFETIEYYFQAKMKLKYIALIRFIATVIVSIARIAIVVLDWGMIGFIATYLLEAIIIAILLYVLYRKKSSTQWHLNKKYAKSLFSRCWYMAISGLMSTIYMRIDQIMLGSMLIEKTENGIYAAAVRIAEMWYFVPTAIIAAFQPVIIEKRKIGEKEYEDSIQKLYDIIALVGIAFGIGISLFGWIAIDILYGKEYSEASTILSVSVWAGLFATLGSARSIWLINENLQKYTLLYTVSGSLLNIGLNYILIPKLGAMGAAIATLITQFFANIGILMFIKETRKSSIMMIQAILKNNIAIEGVKHFFRKNHK